MTPAQIRKKASRNELEVEHIIEAARSRDPSVCETLRTLKTELKWPDDNVVNGILVVPYGKWIDTACCFIEKGFSGLVDMATENHRPSSYANYCIAFLEAYQTEDSVAAMVDLLRFVENDPTSVPEFSKKLISALNLALSFKGAPRVTVDQESKIRTFLHKALTAPDESIDKAVTMLALRGVGDQHSIELIKASDPLPSPWQDTQSVAVRAIRKRLKNQA